MFIKHFGNQTLLKCFFAKQEGHNACETCHSGGWCGPVMPHFMPIAIFQVEYSDKKRQRSLDYSLA